MAMPFLNFPQNPINFKKLKKKPKDQGFKSLSAFLTSIAIYISVFYVFNQSPSTLFCTTTFWFFIANTIIIIVAADFGSFSSPKERDYLYDEYVKNEHVTKPKTIVSSLEVITEPAKPCERTIFSDDNGQDIQEIPEEKIICVVKLQDDEPQCFVENPKDIFEEREKQRTVMNVNRKPKSRRKTRSMKKCDRSVSDKAVIAEALEAEDHKVALHRTLSERYDCGGGDQSMLEASNEFEIMSDEELNRRVEEFIRKFNREIRLQAVRS